MIELDTASEPIAGRLSQPDGQFRPFHGWLELTSLIETVRVDRGSSEPSPTAPERRR